MNRYQTTKNNENNNLQASCEVIVWGREFGFEYNLLFIKSIGGRIPHFEASRMGSLIVPVNSTASPLKNNGEKTKYSPGQHPNSQKNLEKGRIQPGEVRNPNGRPRKTLAWTECIRQIGDEVNEETLLTNRETLVRDLFKIALDTETPVATRYAISTFLVEREEGKATQRKEIEATGLPNNVIFLPQKIQAQVIENSEEGDYEVIGESKES